MKPLRLSPYPSPGNARMRMQSMPMMMRNISSNPKLIPQIIPVKKVRFEPQPIAPSVPIAPPNPPLKSSNVKTTIQRLRTLVNKAIESQEIPAVTQIVDGSSDLLYDTEKKILSCNGTVEIFQGASVPVPEKKPVPPNTTYPLTVWGPMLQYMDSTHPERIMSTITPMDSSPPSSTTPSLAFRLVGSTPEKEVSSPYYAFYNLIGVRGQTAPKNKVSSNGPGGYIGWNEKDRGAFHLWNIPTPDNEGGFLFHQNEDEIADLSSDHVRFHAVSIELGNRSKAESNVSTLLASPNASTFFAPTEVNGTSPAGILTLNGEYIFQDARDMLTLYLQGVDADKKSVVSYSGLFSLLITSVDRKEDCTLYTQGAVTHQGQVLLGSNGARVVTHKGLHVTSTKASCITITSTLSKRFRFCVWMMTSGK